MPRMGRSSRMGEIREAVVAGGGPGRRLAACAGVALLLVLTVLAAPAAAVSGAGRWQPLSLWGGDVKALTFSPDDPDRAFAGTSSGQVYVSTNGGATWRNAGSFLPFPGWVVSRLDFDPNRPQRLWAALRGVWGSGQVALSD